MKFKQRIILLLASGTITIVSIFYGSLLPFHKAQLVNQMIERAPQSLTLGDLKEIFAYVLTYPSPLGQEETSYQILKLTDEALSAKRFSTKEIDELLEFENSFVRPLIRGSFKYPYGNIRLIFALASVYHDAGDLYGEKNFYNRAEELYKIGLELNPHRPQFLYGLFQIYLQENRINEAKAVGKEILKLWPTDQKTERIISGL